eukprot:m.64039 g.64039  ORF g.64039 m.64039 type:complete len:420 (+) comp16401_c0_seq2:206-1465(+)
MPSAFGLAEKTVSVFVDRPTLCAPPRDVRCEVRGPGGWMCKNRVRRDEDESTDRFDIFSITLKPRCCGVYRARLILDGRPLSKTYTIEVSESDMATRNQTSNSRKSRDVTPRDATPRDSHHTPLKYAKLKRELQPEELNRLAVPSQSMPYYRRTTPVPEDRAASASPPSERRARQSKKYCCVCDKKLKSGRAYEHTGKYYCKDDYHTVLQQEKDDRKAAKQRARAQRENSEKFVELTIKEIKLARKLFRGCDSYSDGVVLVENFEGLVQTFMVQKYGVTSLEQVWTACMPIMKELRLKSQVIVREREYLKLLCACQRHVRTTTDIYTTLPVQVEKSRSDRPGKTSDEPKAVNDIKRMKKVRHAWEDESAPSEDVQLVEAAFAFVDEEEKRVQSPADFAHDEDPSVPITGDKAADAWMFY